MHNVSPFADLLTLQNEMREGFVPPAVVENSRDAEIAELNQRLAEKDAQIFALREAVQPFLDVVFVDPQDRKFADAAKAIEKALAPKNPA